ncbi:conserved membrane hypothetical protein [uncultured delta proteobacterium]|uniref:Uncharacterized protein n=1 Tax=uncultured delta proteobacterium TaxID=34034 RepID=A0A212K1R1_9DELT|nr:conserved membrane hypothetical protein [uncultured delta proteobacterium]
MATLKQKNQPFLITALVLNCLYVYIFILNNPIQYADLSSFLNAQNAIVSSGIFIISITINSLFSGQNKARLVFFKYKFYFPGCYAFTKYIKSDLRVDKKILEENYGELPIDNEEQNRVWYKMYKDVSNRGSVSLAHKHYLFFRDYFFLIIVLTISVTIYLLIFDMDVIIYKYKLFFPIAVSSSKCNTQSLGIGVF